MTEKIEADWVLKTMAAMAAADQRLDASEVGLIQEAYGELTGQSVSVSGVVSAVQTYARQDVVADLSRIAGSLSPETKEAILSGAYRMLAANNHISPDEREKLHAIAAALMVSDDEYAPVLQKLENA